MFLLLLHIDFNATQFVRCVTMDASCNLTHSLYNQYTAIQVQHEASKQLIRQQYLYRHSSPFSQHRLPARRPVYERRRFSHHESVRVLRAH